MEKAKEVLSKYFDKIEVELKNEKKDSFIADLSQLRSNIFKLLNEYTSTKADEWKKMELLLEKLSKDFADETWSKDFNTIYVSFSLFRGNRVFEKRLLKVLGREENSTWEGADIRPAILAVLTQRRKEIKSQNDSVTLTRFDELKDLIKKFITGDYTDNKMRLYKKAKEEMRSDFWKNDEDIKFLSKGIYLYNQYMCDQKIHEIWMKYVAV